MIQDIFPHSWDITYKNIKPGTNSMVLFLMREGFWSVRTKKV